MFYENNYDSLTMNRLLQSNICNNLVKVPSGSYLISDNDGTYAIDIEELYVMSNLITNELFVRWLVECRIENYIDKTYRYFNIINTANAVSYNCSNNTYQIKEGFELHPVQGVNWYGAMQFANFFGASLLTELEWEVCALAGNDQYIYPWGNKVPCEELANYGNNIGSTTPVKQYPANAWGLYDMAGNLREWCLDTYYPNQKYSYQFITQPDPNNLYKVVKGGAWDKTTYHLNTRHSAGKFMRLGTLGIGFRLAFRNGISNKLL